MRHTATTTTTTTSGKRTKKGLREAGRRKWDLYSGLFVLLRKRLKFSGKQWRDVLRGVLARYVRRLFSRLRPTVSDLLTEGQLDRHG